MSSFAIYIYTLGWVDIGTRTKVPPRFVAFLAKVPKIGTKKVFGPSDRFIVGHNFLGHAPYKGPTFFSHAIWISNTQNLT
jgi:hypothetical protein